MNFFKLLLLCLVLWLSAECVSGGEKKKGLLRTVGDAVKAKGIKKLTGSSKKHKHAYKKGKISKATKLAKNKKVRKAIAAAIGAYATYRGAKWVMKRASKSLKTDKGYEYFFSERDMRVQSGYQRCRHRLPATSDQSLGNLWLTERSRVSEVYFQCPLDQACCDLACCSFARSGLSFPWWAILVIVLGILCCCCCCAFFIVYKFFRSLLDCCLGASDEEEEVHHTKGQDNYAMQPQGGYPVVHTVHTTHTEPTPTY